MENLQSSMSTLLGTPEITETQPGIAAVIHLTIPRSQMQSRMPEAIQEVATALANQGIPPAGPLFAHHLTTSSSTFDFEVGFPVAKPVQSEGRVKAGEFPGARIARAVYHGNYQGLFAAWYEFDQWITREGLSGRGDLWEIYLSGPESSPDPSHWRTELCLPLQGDPQ